MDNYGYIGLPLGFGLALSMNDRALNGYSQMTEAEKERVILRCKDAKSDREVEKIINSIANDGGFDRLLDDIDLEDDDHNVTGMGDLSRNF